MSCGHARIHTHDAGTWTVVVCVECDHTWDEHPGTLEFVEGQIAGLAFVLLTPRDERLAGWLDPETDPCCGVCGHHVDVHDMLGGCMYHDHELDRPCGCAGFRHGS